MLDPALVDLVKKAKSNLYKSEHRHVLAYLQSRGLTISVLQEFGIGYHVGYSAYDKWHDRVIIPVHDVFGHLVGFQARAMFDYKAAKVGKFVNNTGLMKSDHCFGANIILPECIRTGWVSVAEGPMDVMAARVMGIPTVACMGASISQKQMFILACFVQSVITLANSDDAGSRMLETVELEAQNFELGHVALKMGKFGRGIKDVNNLLELVGPVKGGDALRKGILSCLK
jgi:DNA primase